MNVEGFSKESLKALIEDGIITVDDLLDAVIAREAGTPEVCTITELVKMGYPRKSIEAAVNGQYSSFFARRTSKNGKWKINYKKFKTYWDRGLLERTAI